MGTWHIERYGITVVYPVVSIMTAGGIEYSTGYIHWQSLRVSDPPPQGVGLVLECIGPVKRWTDTYVNRKLENQISFLKQNWIKFYPIFPYPKKVSLA